MSAERFALTNAERHSLLWERLLGHCNARIASLRIENDRDGDPIATASLRGRIAAFKEIVGLDAPPPTKD